MKALFPDDYETYGKRVPLFFPSLRKAPAYQNGPLHGRLLPEEQGAAGPHRDGRLLDRSHRQNVFPGF